MNSNMMNRNSMGCINRGGVNHRNTESMCRRQDMDSNNDCNRSGNMTGNNGCNCSGNMMENNGCSRSENMTRNNNCNCSGNMMENNRCNRSGNMTENNSCNHSGNMMENNSCNRSGNMMGNNGCNCQNEQQLMNMNKGQLLNYLNHVSFSMYDTVLFLDTHPTDREAIAYFNEMKQARKIALKIYQQKFAPLLLDGVDTNCEWTWGMEPLPWENC